MNYMEYPLDPDELLRRARKAERMLANPDSEEGMRWLADEFLKTNRVRIERMRSIERAERVHERLMEECPDYAVTYHVLHP